MHRRQPLPRLWLMTDERQGEGLWRALDRLPRGAGIVFRHYRVETAERRALFDKVRRIARRKSHLLILAGSAAQARAWKANGRHGRGPRNGAPVLTASVHHLRQLRAAEQDGADLVFISPVFATRSHPGARPLGRLRFEMLARRTRLPAIALGGMDGKRARTLSGAYGWAAVDAWTR